jgi:hypothetical protein
MHKPSRIRAFFMHALVSLALIGIILWLTYFYWFPRDFIKAGGVQGLLILVAVDMVLGPLLTLIIFNPKKKSSLLVLDLTVIAILQLGCMAYGVRLIYQERPIVQLLADDGVHVHAVADFRQHGIELAEIPASGSNPGFFVLDYPMDESVNEMKFLGDFMGEPYDMAPGRFLNPETMSEDSYKQKMDFVLDRLDDKTRAAIGELPARESCTWLPVSSMHFNGFGCLNNVEGLIELKIR